MSPVYLKCSEGKRLLASFFGLHPSLVSEIHAVMKAQMPGAKKAVLAAYGEVSWLASVVGVFVSIRYLVDRPSSSFCRTVSRLLVHLFVCGRLRFFLSLSVSIYSVFCLSISISISISISHT